MRGLNRVLSTELPIYARLLIHATLPLAYSKEPYVIIKVNICYMILSCFKTFYNVLL